MAIYFYRTNGPYGAFSNFATYGFDLEGKHWPTSEHYFQAQKFAGTAHEEEIRQAPTARRAAAMGRQRWRPLRGDWEDVKLRVMRRAIRSKFMNYPDLLALLLSTDDEDIVEATKADGYWGCGSDGRGQNMLGKLLMELRAECRTGKAPDLECSS